MKKENQAINVLKGVACILVVLNHFHGTDPIGDIINVLSHFGVPVFFMVSGYFMYSNGQTLKKLPAKLKHSFSLIVLSIGIFILDRIYRNWLFYGTFLRKDIVVNDIISHFSWKTIIFTLQWSQKLVGIGQWFLIALFQAYLIFFIVYLVRLGKVIEKKGIWIATILFILHILGRAILVWSGETEFLGVGLSETVVVRNVWFDAIPFMLVGLSIRVNQEKIHIFMAKYNFKFYYFVIGLLVSIGEFYLTKAIGLELNSVLYFGTIAAVVYAFIWATENPYGLTKNWIGHCFNHIGKNESMLVYFLHYYIGEYLFFFVKKIGGNVEQLSIYFFPALVLFFSLLVSFLLYHIKKILSKNPHYSLGYVMSIAICISFLFLPAANEWGLICRTTENGQTQANITKLIDQNNYGTILVTAQNSNTFTIDSIEIPVQQFINGGIVRGSGKVNDDEYEYSVMYVDTSTVEITMSANVAQVRLWGR